MKEVLYACAGGVCQMYFAVNTDLSAKIRLGRCFVDVCCGAVNSCLQCFQRIVELLCFFLFFFLFPICISKRIFQFSLARVHRRSSGEKRHRASEQKNLNGLLIHCVTSFPHFVRHCQPAKISYLISALSTGVFCLCTRLGSSSISFLHRSKPRACFAHDSTLAAWVVLAEAHSLAEMGSSICCFMWSCFMLW